MEEIKQKLQEEKKQILMELQTQRAFNQDDFRKDVGDEVDSSVNEQARELSLLMRDRNRDRLEAIEEAIQRMQTGDYGFCEECGDPIPKRRLIAMPLARMCVNCQQDQERANTALSATSSTMYLNSLPPEN
jgi:DnaK suppressor protein|tara:strand:- start:12958 stop:13350 length:393 start_codon:yes stop_codon:yes gene_type:complete